MCQKTFSNKCKEIKPIFELLTLGVFALLGLATVVFIISLIISPNYPCSQAKINYELRSENKNLREHNQLLLGILKDDIEDDIKKFRKDMSDFKTLGNDLLPKLKEKFDTE